jgi:hypothetical protein
MNNFNLKKFLIENKLTSNSREIAESKQVGTVYHFTGVPNIKKILANGLPFLEDNQFTNNIPVDRKKAYSISVTRSPNFNGRNPHNFKSRGCRIVLDGDKIAQRYKIAPINIDNTWSSHYLTKKSDHHYFPTKFDNWFEERIYSPNSGYLPIEYIKQIDIIWHKSDKLSPKYVEMINSLNTAKIPINRVNKF